MNASPAVRRLAALLIAAAGLVHGFLAPEYLEEKPYIGILFALSVPVTLAVAVALWRRDHIAAWGSGALLAGSMILLFVLSRTVGLPGFHETNWVEGVPALLTEAAYLAVVARPMLSAASARSESRTSASV